MKQFWSGWTSEDRQVYPIRICLLFSPISRMFLRECRVNSKLNLSFTPEHRTKARYIEENGK